MRDFSSLAQDQSNLSSDVGLRDLFDTYRLSDKNNILKIVLYLPFGLLLVVVRLIICTLGLLVLFVLPRTSAWNYIFKGLCKILGIVIKVDNKHFDDNAKLLIANHVSVFDRLAINMMKPCNTITKKFQIKNLDALSFWKDGDHLYSGELTENELLAFQSSIENSSLPVLHFPEGATTNGKVGLLKFHPSVFSFNYIVQPIVIQVSLSSFISVSPSVLGSNVCADIFWPFFVPQMYYNLKVLPSMVKQPGEPSLDFSKRVQQTMAKATGLNPTVYTSSDKFELIKQLRLTIASTDSSSSPDKENKSASDQYTQILLRSRELASKQQPTLNTAAKSFGKSPKERMLSYHERKAMLIEAARVKYLLKHNML